MYLVQTRINAVFDEKQALKSFREWVGKFAVEKSGNAVKTIEGTIIVPVATVRGNAEVEMAAEVGILDKARYHRDTEQYRRDYERWNKSDGKGMMMPLSPTKDHYYQRKDIRIPVRVDCKTIFGMDIDDELLPPGTVGKISAAAVKIVERNLDNKAQHNQETFDGRSYDENVIRDQISKVVNRELRRKVKDAVRKYDKVYSTDYSENGTGWSGVIYEVPFHVVRYEHEGREYIYAVDAVAGTTEVGTKPSTVVDWLISQALTWTFAVVAACAIYFYIKPWFYSLF